MNENVYTHELNYDLIKRAANGDESALEEVLRIYEPFINSLASYDTPGPDGKVHRMINEDWKVQLQMRLMDAIQTKWRKLI